MPHKIVFPYSTATLETVCAVVYVFYLVVTATALMAVSHSPTDCSGTSVFIYVLASWIYNASNHLMNMLVAHAVERKRDPPSSNASSHMCTRVVVTFVLLIVLGATTTVVYYGVAALRAMCLPPYWVGTITFLLFMQITFGAHAIVGFAIAWNVLEWECARPASVELTYVATPV